MSLKNEGDEGEEIIIEFTSNAAVEEALSDG